MSIFSAISPTSTFAIALLDGYEGAAGYGNYAIQNGDGSFRRNDDGSSNSLALPFEVNFFGNTYNDFFINTNGNISFGSDLGEYTPQAFTGNSTSLPPLIAPYWADVDTSCTTCGEIYVAAPNADTAIITWSNVGHFDGNNNKTNNFQLVLHNRESETGGSGNFDIEFRYDRLEWTTGDASEGSGGLGGIEAVAGYDSGTGEFLTLPGSLSAEVLDLASTSNVNIDTPGLWTTAIRNGIMSDGSTSDTPLLPVIITPEDGFIFDFEIEANTPIWIDPEVAIGYEYEVSSGPNIATVTLPSGFGDDTYDLYLWNSGSGEYNDSGIDLLAGIEFDLTTIDASGLNNFAIRGIETSAEVDPTDPLAFVTGLTFIEGGSVSMSQAPISVWIDGDSTGIVPAPGSIPLIGAGLLGWSIFRRRSK